MTHGLKMHGKSSNRADFAPPEVLVETGADGTVLLRSTQPLGSFSTLGSLVDEGARDAPERVFLAERDGDGWSTVTYGEARVAVRAIGASLLDLGASQTRPLVILSDNSIDCALVTLAAHYCGILLVPVTSGYSKSAKEFEKLREIIDVTGPGVVFASDRATYGRAIDSVMPPDARVVIGDGVDLREGWLALSELRAHADPDSIADAASQNVTIHTPAKIMFTSGSTSVPKGVVTTHGMLTANHQAISQLWWFLGHKPPVLLDWLPWAHGFGSNQNFLMVLARKGSFYIDDGSPQPDGIGRTVENIKLVSPTVVYSVPYAYQMLLPYLESDGAAARSFFRELKAIFYAAADMPRTLWRRYEELADKHAGTRPYFTSSWGMTEVLASTYVHYPIAEAGNIGLPLPGAEIKLVPVGDKMEIRVRGPMVTPGYWKNNELTAASFDEQGFFRSGDAARLADPDRPESGILYDGRIGENFKLSTGVWVSVGDLRVRAIAAGEPVVMDVVVTGHGQREAGLLVFLDLKASARISGLPDDAPLRDLARNEAVRARVAAMLERLTNGGEGGTKVRRALIMEEPPVPGSEISEKGSLNQRAVLERRAAMVERLYAPGADADRIEFAGQGR